jgi:hypothetical protein
MPSSVIYKRNSGEVFAPEPALKSENWFPFVRREVSGVRFLKLKVTV